jgi:uncharacterized membrane protein SirB2
MTTWRMRTLRWMLKATKTLSVYIILTAFPLQQRLQKHASMLRYTYFACLVMLSPPSPLYVRLSRLKTTVKRRTFRPTVTQWGGCDVEKIGAL